MYEIIVLAGGSSSEREVSLRSGGAVADALRAQGYTVTIVDPAENFLAQQETLQRADAIFPALHGKGGEDGEVQKILESWKVPFVGSDSRASALCFDKWRFREFVAGHGILVPRGEQVTAGTFMHSPLVRKPFVLKPHDGGSSVDTHIIRDPAQFDPATVSAVFERHPQMLLEELIDGVEVTVGVLGDEPLPVVEIVPPENGEFDYENKYNGQTQELCPPAHVDSKTQQKLQEIALDVHRLCGCRDLSRSDFIVATDGALYLLETNTLPGMTDQSLFPKAAGVAGLSMQQTVDRLLQMAIARGAKVSA